MKNIATISQHTNIQRTTSKHQKHVRQDYPKGILPASRLRQEQNQCLFSCNWLVLLCCLFFGAFGYTPQIQAQVNNAPIEDTLYVCTEVLTPTVICHNFIDPDGHNSIIVSGSTTFNCSLTFLNDTCFRYTGLPGFSGIDTVILSVCDDQVPAACSSPQVVVAVGCVAPQAMNDNAIITSTSVTINGQVLNTIGGLSGITMDILANDEALCIDDVRLNISQLPNNGTASLTATQDLVYVPNNGFSGTDVLQYTSCNECDECTTATVTITVVQPQEPCDNDIIDCVGPFTTTNLCPEFCGINTENLAGISLEAQEGTIDPAIDGCARYIPNPEFRGTDTLILIGCDFAGACDTVYAFVTVEPACGNTPPIANDDGTLTIVNTPVPIEVLDNDEDTDGQLLTITSTTNPPNGIANIDVASGMIIYTPNTDFVGIDSFMYVVCDETNLCDTATVFIQVSDPCEEPDYEFCTETLTGIEICVDFCALAGRDSVHVVEANTTFNCSVTLLNETCIRYTPLPGFVGRDTVTIIGCDTQQFCDTILTFVNIECAEPHAVDDVAILDEGNNINIPVLANDVEPCDNPLQTTIVAEPSNGTASVQADGSIDYTPSAGFSGEDQLTYIACSVCDEERGLQFCDTAMVTIDVPTPTAFETLNPQPDVVQTPFETTIDIVVLQNDEGTSLNITTITEEPQNGIVNINGDGSLTYTPDSSFAGEDAFFYEVCDIADSCETEIVMVTVLPADAEPQPPIAQNDVATTPVQTPVTISILANDSDPENAELVFVHAFELENGSVVPNADGTITYTPNDDFVGLDTFQYIVCDNQQLCDTALVGVAVGTETPQNQAPLASDDGANTTQDTPIAINVLLNDGDSESDSLAVTIVSQPPNGTGTVTAEGQIIYTPNPDFVGDDYFTYIVCDTGLPPLCDTAYVGVTVTETNPPPFVPLNPQPDVLQTPFDATVTVDVLQNDEGTNLSIEDITDPQNGTISLNPDGTISYIPDLGFEGEDVFFYEVCDEEGNCAEELVSITVLPREAEPQAPIAHNDVGETTNGIPVVIAITANDNDPENGDLMITHISEPVNGSIIENVDGTITYTPNVNFEGIDTFSYVICDETDLCDTAIVAVAVNADLPNNPPLAMDDIDTTFVNNSLEINILQNDLDEENQMVTVSIASEPTNGLVIIDSTNQDNIIYTPDSNFIGTDYLTYQVCDSGDPSLCDTAYVSILVLEPVITDTIALDPAPDVNFTPFETAVTISVLNNDVGDTPTVNGISQQPENGTVNINVDGTITYTPNAGFSGTDNFFYEVCDGGDVECQNEIVSVNVLPEGSNNLPPLVNNDIATTPRQTPINIPVISNDDDPEGSPLTITDVSDPQGGETNINSDGTIEYTPDPNFEGVDQFTYIVCDDETPPACTQGTVTVVVGEGTEFAKPQALDDEATTTLEEPVTITVLDNDSDPEGDRLLVSITSPPSHGTVVAINETEIIYTPDTGFVGVDYFTYRICEDTEFNLCDTAYVMVTVEDTVALNLQPDVVQTPFDTPVIIDVLANDEGRTPMINEISQEPQNGTVTINADGTITYTPNSDFEGEDAFFYEACDINNVCAEELVAITVLPRDSEPLPPLANDDVIDTAIDNPVTIPVLANDSDPEGQPLTITNVSDPQGGEATISEDSTQIIYQPDTGFVGLDTFTYVVCDAQGLCDTAIVGVVVGIDTPSLQPPLAQDDERTTPFNTPITIDILANDSDEDSDSFTPSLISTPLNGLAVLNADGTVTYTPDSTFSGEDFLTYQICDNEVPSLCDTAYIRITVSENSGNETPIAINDTVFTSINARVDIVPIANDSDPNHAVQELIFSVISEPRNGSTLVSGNEVAYLPNIGFAGQDEFAYTICDPEGACDTAIVVILIAEGVNAQPDIEFTNESESIILRPLDNDLGAGIEITDFTLPEFGEAVKDSSCNIIYTPDSGYVGTDYIPYEICDTTGACDNSIITIIVLPDTVGNLPPRAHNDIDSTAINTALEINVLGNDSDPNNDTLSITNNSQPSNGTVAILNEGDLLVYVPAQDFVGVDSFIYEVCDSLGACDTATVVVSVGTDSLTNHPPRADDDIRTTDENTLIEIDVLVNDDDPDGDNIFVTDVTPPSNGITSLQEDGTIIYVPDNGFSGVDYFVYTICDNGSPSLCDTAFVAVSVIDLGDNDPDIFVEIPEDTDTTLCMEDYRNLGIDFPIDTIVIFEIPEHGSPFYVDSDSCIAYSPDAEYVGLDEFVIGVCDTIGNCDSVNIVINVLPEFDAPEAVDDIDTTLINTSIIIDVVANDFDADGDTLIIVAIDTPREPQHGTTLITMEGVQYQPDSNFVGIDTFSYIVTDTTGQVDTAEVIVVVLEELPDTIPPLIIAFDDRDTTLLNNSVTIDVLDNDTLPDSAEPSQLTILDDAINGTTTVNLGEIGDSNITYIPSIGFVGTDTFSYILCVGALCDTAEVIVEVLPDGNIPCELRFANFFSPNGDGTNETFVIEGLGATCFAETTFKFIVFNRWGDIVYEKDDYQPIIDAWNGGFKNDIGNPVPDGTYFYLLWYNFEGEDTDEAGFIEVLR